MDKKEENAGQEGCCSDGKGSCCTGGKCCPGKWALGLVLLLIAGMIGYSFGKCNYSKWCCKGDMSKCPITGEKSPTPAAK